MILDTWEEKIISVSSTKDPSLGFLGSSCQGGRTSRNRTNKDVQARVDHQRVPFENQPTRHFFVGYDVKTVTSMLVRDIGDKMCW